MLLVKWIPVQSILAFLCFLLSGAASVGYETIWLRQAMTYFGVVTPVLSCVLSVFMAGLGLGTWLAGRFTARLSNFATIRCYAIIEVSIGIYAFFVPGLFRAAFTLLLPIAQSDPSLYLLASCLAIAVILLPVATLIGCTFPLLMHFLKAYRGEHNNFGFLYIANLLGAFLGCLYPLITIEMVGFNQSIFITAILNFLTAVFAVIAACFSGTTQSSPEKLDTNAKRPKAIISRWQATALFTFGLVTMGSEVMWMKALTPLLAPTVYSFAFVLAMYLLASAAGAYYYVNKGRNADTHSRMLKLLPMSALLPIIFCSLSLLSILSVVSLALVCFCLGYMTPKIIDDIAGDDARDASRAYIFNFAGCILGPLVTTYLLFPHWGIKGTLIIYAFLLLAVVSASTGIKKAGIGLFVLLLVPSVMLHNSEDELANNGVLYRDSIGFEGGLMTEVNNVMNKVLMVNGIGMTNSTTVTKFMAYLPLAFHPQPKSALVICFGMGTTVRSMTTWPLEKITAVELSEGVIKSFPYFHDDAKNVLADPRVNIVVDDGRRFLNYTNEKFDVVTIDPPPPVYASGSGLLYTNEFLSFIKMRLNKGGILQHWIYLPGETPLYVVYSNAAINSIKNSFKYIKIYKSIEFSGYHVLASDEPLPEITPEEMLKKLPVKSIADLQEWEKDKSIGNILAKGLRQVDEATILHPEYKDIYMSDDMPYNEFTVLRNLKLWQPTANPLPLF